MEDGSKSATLAMVTDSVNKESRVSKDREEVRVSLNLYSIT